MDLQDTKTETASREIQAASHQAVRFVGAGAPIVLLPEGFTAEDLSHTLAAPTRKKGTVQLNDAESFIAVVNDQKGESTRLFSTIEPPTFTAVFNHIAFGTGWGDHQARYNAPLAPEWKAWTGMDGKKVGQVDLAQFIESNLVDVVFIAADPATREPGSPDGSTLLEVCRTLEAKKKVDFKSSVRLSDGSTQFTYDEDVQGSARQGQLQVPEQFSLGIPVFENGDKWRVDVRFRYRIDGGNLVMWLELVRPHKVIEQAVKDLREKIAAATELQILNGAPNTARN
ncbi:YfdQ family protein [Delftia acidovorans]|uniref:YfdQ family protein n=1 Tax=Delftia acidovorans TaxID=80866 RepID=A0A7T2S612_DELAC|nr:YfdQ family protein [Delftia acidovorans]QPS09599.1 YfdQ family protein [Delftia acidovorans]